MNILVTGAAGFIGSHLTAYLAKQGNRIYALDNFNDYYSTSLKKYRAAELKNIYGITITNLNIANRNKLNNYIKTLNIDSIVNLAAQAGIRLPVSEYWRYSESNLTGFANLAELACQYSIPSFIFASSSSVYGENQATNFSEKQNELKPISYYGTTKLSNEILSKSLAKQSETVFRGLRLFTVYGPKGRPDMAYFKLIRCAVTGDNFTMYGDGKLQRDFTYIDDVILSIDKLIKDLTKYQKGFSDIVNIGGGAPHSLIEIIEIIQKLTGKKIKIDVRTNNPNDVPFTSANYEYLHSLIGSHPETDINDGLAKTLDWCNKPEVKIQLKNWI